MNGIINAISAFAAWLLGLFVKLFAALWDIVNDLMIAGADGLLSALATLLSAVPAPTFLQNVNLQTLFNGLGADVLYFVGVFNIGAGIALLGSGFAFRMLRKVVTLFQW
ncbi:MULTISPECIES: DUF2523 family protein [unclassified Cupriavidus]|uniref:DUF2523 family protein n=1 Tax=unclassified Cupriavidus TaxID=2640874 RepID=UPI001C0069C9|nr:MULTISPECIES: DUF2523 family protein [unclassified Cupriavidus]MCA3182635.1 DUF2523 domain-containing protein [Cupriavidus sp.]MCA3193001.1 DUF2523 domain-containing protein [Cupriavidus sp.]MCA3195853.1 DUF2523 domain-containing protein [Cupriavidus sp.]MCA3204754.1 DUF2523 domain-containing protein [Cupriavidus sp.]MCA3206886.1 DUF2523 domain-containing protein [Cupriavidus sp.]